MPSDSEVRVTQMQKLIVILLSILTLSGLIGCERGGSIAPSSQPGVGSPASPLPGTDGKSGGTWATVLYSSDTPIAGFQFNVTGVDITGTRDGAAETAGFTVSATNDTVLGFSKGSTIPAGEGILTVLDLSTTGNACLIDVIVSDSNGVVLSTSVENCLTIRVINELVPPENPESPTTREVSYISDVPIAGFQFDVTGVDVTGASGGAAETAGFTVSTANNRVLGFSFAGDTIPVTVTGAGSGALTVLELTGSGNACLTNVIISDSNGIELETSVTNCLTINISSSGPTSVDVLYDTVTPIAGFQFDVTGINVSGVSGGAAETASFTVSTANNRVLGFSFTGDTIPAGSGTLTVLALTGSGNACLTNVIISDSSGNALTTSVQDCLTLNILGSP